MTNLPADRVRSLLGIPETLPVVILQNTRNGQDTTVITIGTGETKTELIIDKKTENVTSDDIISLRNDISAKIGSSGFFTKIAARYFGWWIIFSGSITLFAVCPVCGSSACAGSFVTTGIYAALLTIIKNSGSRLKHLIRRRRTRDGSDGAKTG